MARKKKTKPEIDVVALDIGATFCKMALVEKRLDGLHVIQKQISPTLKEGFISDKNENSGFALAHVLHSESGHVPDILASTTRFSALHVILAALHNDDIKTVLTFCRQMGVDVTAVATRKKTIYADDYFEAKRSDAIDAVIIVGGFERKREAQLRELVIHVSDLLHDVPKKAPIIFLGSQEVLEKIQYIFEGERQFFLVPELWPGKKSQNFLPLYLHLQDLLVKKSKTDSFISQFSEANETEIESGFSALLASLSLLTEVWQENVLLIDVGSQKGVACWSEYQDGFSLPVLKNMDNERIVLQADTASAQETPAFGLQIFSLMGFGTESSQILKELSRENIQLYWPQDAKLSLPDRILNHLLLYPDTFPDEADLIWMEALLRSYLKKIWSSIPNDFRPRHIVFTGSFFGSGERLNSFLEHVFLQVRPDFSASIWVNNGPYLPLYGMLTKLEQNIPLDMNEIVSKATEYIRIIGKSNRSGQIAKIVVDTHTDKLAEYEISADSIERIDFVAEHKAVIKVIPVPKARVPGYKKGEEVILRTETALGGLIVDARE